MTGHGRWTGSRTRMTAITKPSCLSFRDSVKGRTDQPFIDLDEIGFARYK
jgi:hypothetical protein